MSELRKTITIVNQRGLHARASAKLVEVTTRWPEATEIQVAKDGRAVDGRSILELIVAGEDAEGAMAEIAQLVETGFGEE